MEDEQFSTDRRDVDGEKITLTVDGQGRILIPEDIREQLGIESNDRVSATLVGSVLEINPTASSELQTATADRDDWTNSTPTDAGKALFGPIDRDDRQNDR